MTKKELIFLGPPACSKETQTNKLSTHLNLPHIDTGSLLRAEIAKYTLIHYDNAQLINRLKA